MPIEQDVTQDSLGHFGIQEVQRVVLLALLKPGTPLLRFHSSLLGAARLPFVLGEIAVRLGEDLFDAAGQRWKMRNGSKTFLGFWFWEKVLHLWLWALGAASSSCSLSESPCCSAASFRRLVRASALRMLARTLWCSAGSMLFTSSNLEGHQTFRNNSQWLRFQGRFAVK